MNAKCGYGTPRVHKTNCLAVIVLPTLSRFFSAICRIYKKIVVPAVSSFDELKN